MAKIFAIMGRIISAAINKASHAANFCCLLLFIFVSFFLNYHTRRNLRMASKEPPTPITRPVPQKIGKMVLTMEG